MIHFSTGPMRKCIPSFMIVFPALILIIVLLHVPLAHTIAGGSVNGVYVELGDTSLTIREYSRSASVELALS